MRDALRATLGACVQCRGGVVAGHRNLFLLSAEHCSTITAVAGVGAVVDDVVVISGTATAVILDIVSLP